MLAGRREGIVAGALRRGGCTSAQVVLRLLENLMRLAVVPLAVLLSLAAVAVQAAAPVPVAKAVSPASQPAAATQVSEVSLADVNLSASDSDTRLARATQFVLSSERYLHHSKLHKGMIGYGLTVLEGTKIVRFDVEIVSVMFNFAPQQDVILARARGQNLEDTGIIMGMSGSPVFMNDGAGDRMIGAVAYGFTMQKPSKNGQIFGIQPISQMLAAANLPEEGSALPIASADDKAKLASGNSAGATGQGATAAACIRPDRCWLEAALTPKKVDFTNFGQPANWATPINRGAGQPALHPLASPVMVGSLAPQAMEMLEHGWSDRTLTPVQAGGLGHMAMEELQGLKLCPGSSLAIPMVSGDLDITAVGTVTDIVGDHVIGFGHAMNASGTVDFPMATGYVHAVLPRMDNSFKLAGKVQTVGELTGDEKSAVSGILGSVANTVPMEVQVEWVKSGQRQTFHYTIVHDRDTTAMLAAITAVNSIWSRRNMPPEHTVEYSIACSFDKLGSYQVSNVSAGSNVGDFVSDLVRPVAIMHHNPFGIARLTGIKASVRIDTSGTHAAEILSVRPDRNRYYPGDEVTATVTLKKFMGEKFTRQVRLKLDDDLAAEHYTLKVGSAELALEADKRKEPRRFQPENLPELLDSLNGAVAERNDRLYAAVDLPGEDTAVEQNVVCGTPPTVAAMLKATCPLDVTSSGKVLLSSAKMGMVVQGAAQAELVVQERPQIR